MSSMRTSAAHAHLDDLRRRGYSPGTIANRRCTLNRFRRAVGRDPRYATAAQYALWWEALDHLTPASRATELSHVRAYCRWLVKHDYLKHDPTVRMDRPKLPQRLPRPATDEQIVQALTHTDGREQLVLMLGAMLGLRCVEIARLTWADIADADGGTLRLRVRGKGDKERIVFAHGTLAAELVRRRQLRGAVIVGAHGQQLPAYRISHLGNRALRDAGVPITMHQLRHWYGTSAYAHGAEIVALSKSMGHSSPRTTMVYVDVHDRRVREVCDLVPDFLAGAA